MVKRNDNWCRSLANGIVGNYKLVSFVGAGKIGYVYRGERNEFPGFERAVKLIFDTLKPGWDVEVKKVLQLALVQGVVHFHDLGITSITHDGKTRLCQYTVWDYIPPGENLRSHLKRVKQIDASFLFAVVERILHVLAACDEKGVGRHGDLHSGNILIGDTTTAMLDESLQRRAPIYISDFGYGATGAAKVPKDDYKGLAHIINEMMPIVTYSTATATDRQILQAMQRDLGRFLRDSSGPERRPALELLQVLRRIKSDAQAHMPRIHEPGTSADPGVSPLASAETPSIGQFQVSEMIGDRWKWWQQLFVPTVPARSKILALDIPTVVTGPRGCGKTMLFRRLSERLVVECGAVDDVVKRAQFVALYVNANDFADAFAHYPEQPSSDDEARLTCYANLCVLADLLAVQSARAGRLAEHAPDALLALVGHWLVPDPYLTLVEGEDRLERYRTILEQIKWLFPARGDRIRFPGYDELSQHRWLPHFVQEIRKCCTWIGEKSLLLFIDDFSTPRVSPAMQRVLNRLFLQRSHEFLAKLATEASSSYISEDSSGKNLEDGDDYQLVDMGEESLFLADSERLRFLSEVFSRRLAVDPRVATSATSLESLLGRMPLSKTEFARRLRDVPSNRPTSERPDVGERSQRRGRSRGRVSYFGANVLCDLWSGDTRTLIQLVTDVVDQASEVSQPKGVSDKIKTPVGPELQDRVFRNRGGEWLNSHTRNEPTDPDRVKEELRLINAANPQYALRGEYGDHLKAIVEAFVAAAKELLLGPTYTIREDGGQREVPRMAFRLEIIDEFRIEGLAREIYRDLVRYGLFMRDSRGKSVRGTFVPRLYLRRLLLPYCTLALSKRDSVPVSCKDFTQLLLEPDSFKANFTARRAPDVGLSGQILFSFAENLPAEAPDPTYDDIDEPVASSSAEHADRDDLKDDAADEE